MDEELKEMICREKAITYIPNNNQGGVAGGFNRGIERAFADNLEWITLVDQDSRLSGHKLLRLREPWLTWPDLKLLVGPKILDGRRHEVHGRKRSQTYGAYTRTRMLISSGTTFRAKDWPLLGPMLEWLVVDFVDHAWSFHAGSKGFVLLQHPEVVLNQAFGERHPNPLCRLIGMELYSPTRHFYSIRNLRWLLTQRQVPLDLKWKELAKMSIKPWLWLLCEPRKIENMKAILHALLDPLGSSPEMD
jgi:rhamnosyltransferase